MDYKYSNEYNDNKYSEDLIDVNYEYPRGNYQPRCPYCGRPLYGPNYPLTPGYGRRRPRFYGPNPDCPYR
ncbi:hypothetical protein [Dethiothermospora halolimnae]|uniref:hypothetical protein n=1 Tax=Dethiothermospora halolimnae TaxID=3114390 RepID=UPI003CCC0F13